MKAIIHCGLHKTGTSSVQGFLSDLFGKPEKFLPYYPRPEKLGPGHTHLIDQYRKTGETEELQKILSSAKKINSSEIIISSEDIYTLKETEILKLIDVVGIFSSEIILIITISPYIRRAKSAYIESVKNGWQGEFLNSLDHITNQPPLNNRLINDFLQITKEIKKIFITSKSFDENLGSVFLDAASLPKTQIKTSAPANKSLDEFNTEFWRLVNRYRVDLGAPTYHMAQEKIEALISSHDWMELRKHIPKKEYKFPKSWEPILNSLADEQSEIFKKHKGNSETIGDFENIKYRFPEYFT